jgi:hypothetical protein
MLLIGWVVRGPIHVWMDFNEKKFSRGIKRKIAYNGSIASQENLLSKVCILK